MKKPRQIKFTPRLLALAIQLAMVAPVSAATIIVDSDTGEITGDDGNPATFNGTAFTTQVVGGVRRFFLEGDLTLTATDEVIGTGSRGISLYVGDDTVIPDGASFDMSALGTTAGPGGGSAGVDSSGGTVGGNGGTGGDGGKGDDGGEGGGGGTGGSSGSPGSPGGSGGLGLDGGSGGDGMDGANGGAGGNGGVGGDDGTAGGDGTAGAGGTNFGTGDALAGGGGGAAGGSGGSGGGGGGGAGGDGGEGGVGGNGGAGGVIGADGADGGEGGGGGGGGGGAGQGGAGGSGGTAGGDGGVGGDGGAGGGAFEIVSRGRIILDGDVSATGGDGSAGASSDVSSGDIGDSGSDGDLGTAGFGGSGGSGVDYGGGSIQGNSGKAGSPGSGSIGGGGGEGGAGVGSADGGAAGGDGVDGDPGQQGGIAGNGGSGGAGGAGAGGAGGTVKLVGTAVSGETTVDTAGGIGGDTNNGGDGRFVLGTNIDSTALQTSINNASVAEFAGSRGDNPFYLGVDSTPLLPDLVGGAEMFGLLDGLDAMDFTDVTTSQPANAIAALHKIDFLFDDFIGFDILMFLNLTNESLLIPQLGVDPGNTDFVTELLQGGWATDALFGGTGPTVLTSLGAWDVYATVVAEGNTMYNAAFGTTSSGSFSGGTDFLNGNTIYFAPQASAVPEPGTLALTMAGLAGMGVMRRRRRPKK